MDIKCNKCKSPFKIADSKLPENQIITILCPKCKGKIQVDTRKKTGGAEAQGPAGDRTPPNGTSGLIAELDGDEYDASDKPFDYVEEGARTVLVCEQDPGIKASLEKAVASLEFHSTVPVSARDALKKMRFHSFDLVVLNEIFDTDNPGNNHVLKYLSRMSMDTRRNIFVVLISGTYRTMDEIAAFNRSVNIIIHKDHVGEAEKIIRKGLSEYRFFYRVYRDSMVRTGRL
ncbi:MAG: zinc-ribbon domain-containing protein [Pseudomonadota bacterium]